MNHTIYSRMRKAVSFDFNSICELLESENLPTIDIQQDLLHFFVIERNKKILAVIGLEIYGEEALLRSMVVDREYRNQSLATLLVHELIKYGNDNGVKTIYLITTTAEGYLQGRVSLYSHGQKHRYLFL